MKKLIYLLVALTFLFPTPRAQAALAESDPIPEDNAGAVVCAPDAYLLPPADCLPLGPSEYLTQMAQLGMTLPIQPLVFSRPDPALRQLPTLNYYKVNGDTGTGFYPSLGAAQNKQGASRIVSPGSLLYVVYSQRNDTDHGTYFTLPSGEWMPGDGSTVSLPEAQPGIEFQATPPNGFGWSLDPETAVRSEPNLLRTNKPIGTLGLYQVVQVYSIQSIEGFDWALIGPNQWVEGRNLATVFPDTTPPAGVTNGRWIDVNLAGQSVAVYDHQQMVFATVMASGLGPNWTRPGLFQIYQKKEFETMSGDQGTPDYYYLEDVPWTMYFDKARALHGAYWRARLGFPQSHGCVNMTVGDAHWLYNWANVGEWVYVHDPSGLTPTDPSKYSDGGA